VGILAGKATQGELQGEYYSCIDFQEIDFQKNQFCTVTTVSQHSAVKDGVANYSAEEGSNSSAGVAAFLRLINCYELLSGLVWIHVDAL